MTATMSQVAPALNQLDVEQPRQEHLFRLPDSVTQWCVNRLLKRKEEQNTYILLVMINIILTSLPAALGLYLLEGLIPAPILCLLGAGYFYFHFSTYARSFILALHYSTHRPIFNRNWKFLNSFNSSFLCLFFGLPPWVYYSHHIAMHHCENNTTPFDVSSTMPYRRDSKWQHFTYMLRFAVAIWFELPYVLWRRNRYKLALRCITGEVLFFAALAYLLTQHPIPTFFVFGVPWAVISFAMMQGNWKQHIFVDPDDPDNNYKSTFTCINTPTNSRNFNDGYHIEHHENPGCFWYNLPEYFQKNLHNYVENDAFIFTGIGSMEVGRLVLNGDLDTLADHYVNVGQKKRTKEELIAEFKRRLVVC